MWVGENERSSGSVVATAAGCPGTVKKRGADGLVVSQGVPILTGANHRGGPFRRRPGRKEGSKLWAKPVHPGRIRPLSWQGGGGGGPEGRRFSRLLVDVGNECPGVAKSGPGFPCSRLRRVLRARADGRTRRGPLRSPTAGESGNGRLAIPPSPTPPSLREYRGGPRCRSPR